MGKYHYKQLLKIVSTPSRGKHYTLHQLLNQILSCPKSFFHRIRFSEMLTEPQTY